MPRNHRLSDGVVVYATLLPLKSNKQVLRHINTQHAVAGFLRLKEKQGPDMLQIILMLLLMVGFFGLFAGLVFFSESVIAPESTP